MTGWGVEESTVAPSSYQRGRFLGVRSLKIDVDQGGRNDQQLLTFSSLGANPKIGITLARRNRNMVLVWGLALAVFVLGAALTTRPVRQKAAFVIVVGEQQPWIVQSPNLALYPESD